MIKNILYISLKFLFRDKSSICGFLFIYILFWYMSNSISFNEYRGNLICFLFLTVSMLNEIIFSFDSNLKYGRKYKLRNINIIIPVSRKEVIYQRYIFIFFIIIISAFFVTIINNYFIVEPFVFYSLSYFSIVVFLTMIFSNFSIVLYLLLKYINMIRFRIILIVMNVLFAYTGGFILNMLIIKIVLPFWVNVFLLSISILSVYIFAKINYLITNKSPIEYI